MTYVAMLRGINVGGKHSLPMQHLAKIFTECGCADVRAYIQSGNVVFTAPCKVATEVPATAAKTIEGQFGFAAPVILRTMDEMTAVVRRNPFLKAGLPEISLHVCFLAEQPSTEAVRTLDPDRSPPDQFQVVGREIYLHTPNGMGRTKLTNAYFDSRLSTIGTARNWATVLKLLELMQS